MSVALLLLVKYATSFMAHGRQNLGLTRSPTTVCVNKPCSRPSVQSSTITTTTLFVSESSLTSNTVDDESKLKQKEMTMVRNCHGMPFAIVDGSWNSPRHYTIHLECVLCI